MNTNKSTMNNIISANELKTKGISIAGNLAAKGIETIVTVRGKAAYVILPKKQYDILKEHELTIALMEAEEDVKHKKYKEDSIEDHIKRITNA